MMDSVLKDLISAQLVTQGTITNKSATMIPTLVSLINSTDFAGGRQNKGMATIR